MAEKKSRLKLDRKLLYYVLPAVLVPTILFLIATKGSDLGQGEDDAKAAATALAEREKQLSARFQNPEGEAADEARRALEQQQIKDAQARSSLPPPGALPPPPTSAEIEARSNNKRLTELEASRGFVGDSLKDSERTSVVGQSKSGKKSFLAYSAPVDEKLMAGAASNVAEAATIEKKKDEPEKPFLSDGNDKVQTLKDMTVAKRVDSLYWLSPGTVLRAVLLNAVDTRIPGQITARVTDPVYDSRYGKYLVVPVGSRLIGQYSSEIAHGQERVMMAFTSLVTPSGGVVDLASVRASDAIGRVGVAGELHTHFWQRMGVAALFAFESVGMDRLSNSKTTVSTNGSTSTTTNTSEAARIISDAAKQEPRLKPITPNITIEEGQQISIITVANIEIPPVANKR